MTAVQFIIENINIWTSAIKTKSTQGRGGSKKLDLYGVKKLRELILELAVRGKLVPQNPNDEPASVLLERIAAKKARLVRDKKIKTPKKTHSIEASERSSSLPNGWSESRLGSVVNILNGRAYKKDEMLQTGTPLLRVGNLFTSNEWYYSNLQLDPDKYIDHGDLIYAWSASFGPFIWDGSKVIYHYHIWKIDLFDEESLNKNYLYQYLLAITKEIKASGSGIAMIHMTKERMEELIFPVPPLAEQIRITKKIDELMALCDQLEQKTEDSADAHKQLIDILLETLTTTKDASELNKHWVRLSENFDTLITTDYAVEQLKQTILQLAVMGRLVPQDKNEESAGTLLKHIAAEKEQLFKMRSIAKQKPLPNIIDEEKHFSLPKGWEWCRVDTLSLHSEAGWSPKCHGFAREENTWGVLKVSAVTWGEFKPQENKRLPDNLEPRPEYEVKENDFLISRANTAELVARSVVVPASTEKKLMMSDKIIRFVFSKYVSPDYINLFNNSKWSRDYYARVAGGTSSSMKNVSRNQIQMLVVALPPLEEQHRIITKYNQLISLCNELKNRANEARAIQLHMADAVVYKALGGQVKTIEDAEVKQTMKITTILTLNHEEFSEHAIIAPLLLEAGGSADAKDVWSKTKLSLPDFYAQLKIEIDAKYIAKPARADFLEA
jgi:type I restriction enzyme S subunit